MLAAPTQHIVLFTRCYHVGALLLTPLIMARSTVICFCYSMCVARRHNYTAHTYTHMAVCVYFNVFSQCGAAVLLP